MEKITGTQIYQKISKRVFEREKEERTKLTLLSDKIDESKILKDEENIYLGQVQSNILELFINNKNRIITKDELYDCMEKPSGNALRFHINKLKNITDINIKNIRGSGYILE